MHSPDAGIINVSPGLYMVTISQFFTGLTTNRLLFEIKFPDMPAVVINPLEELAGVVLWKEQFFRV